MSDWEWRAPRIRLVQQASTEKTLAAVERERDALTKLRIRDLVTDEEYL